MGALLSLAIVIGVLVRNNLVRRPGTRPNPPASVVPVDGTTASQANPRLDRERGATTGELITGETAAAKDIDPATFDLSVKNPNSGEIWHYGDIRRSISTDHLSMIWL